MRERSEGTFWEILSHGLSTGQWEGAPLQSLSFLRALPSVTGPICPIISRGWSPCVFIFSSPALCSFMFTAPAVVFVHTYCRRPRVYSSSGLNITFANTRGVLTCQSLSRLCANSTAACRPSVSTSAAFISGELSFKWKPSPKTRMAGFRKKSVLITGSPPALLWHAESPGLHIIGETGPSSPLNSMAGAPFPSYGPLKGNRKCLSCLSHPSLL